MGKPLRLLAAASLATIVLAGCGGGSTDPLATFENQKLAWAPCAPTVVPPSVQGALARLGDRARCAPMRAPLDYANPSRGELTVFVMRVTAEVAADRRGAILLNPGGPGTDGLMLAPLFAGMWTDADPRDPVVGRYKRMSEVYDVVGFSPRGTGESTRLYCGSNEDAPFFANPSADRSVENVAAMVAFGRLVAESCARNPLTPFIHTDATARDMDLIRHLLGDEKLNYLGVSYGTWLGSWYAMLFPERVGRMMLTGVVDLTAGLQDTFLLMPPAKQAVLDDVLAPWAAAHPGVFAMGTDVQAIRQVHRTLPLHLQGTTSEHIQLADSGKAYVAVLTLRAAQVLHALVDAHPAAGEAEMAGLLAAASFVPDPALDARARDIALAINAGYFSNLRHDTGPISLAGGAAMGFAVVCNDEGARMSLADWIAANDEAAARYPLDGGWWTDFPCVSWGGAVVTRPPLSATTRAGGILMLQTEMDPITSTVGAMAAHAAMPNASMVEVTGVDYNHGVLTPYGSACVDGRVTAYFLDDVQPERMTRCPGKALRLPGAAAPAASEFADRIQALVGEGLLVR